MHPSSRALPDCPHGADDDGLSVSWYTGVAAGYSVRGDKDKGCIGHTRTGSRLFPFDNIDEAMKTKGNNE